LPRFKNKTFPANGASTADVNLFVQTAGIIQLSQKSSFMNKIFKLLLVFGLILTAMNLRAQRSSEEKEVKDVILKLFKGMELGDSAMVHSTFFAKTATTATVFLDKNNTPQIRRESSIQGFLDAVGKPHPEVWYEEIWNVKVQVDGELAQAWCDYAFYVDKNFSHCGVDAFQLFKGKDGWRIFHLADTRRKTECNIPKEIQDKHN
jgi:hypothetical protein